VKYFDISEFDCSFTGNNDMNEEFLEKLDALREACGFPFKITSGYRDPEGHPIEAKKPKAGTHARGIAADIHVENGIQKYKIIEEAIKLGFNGIGVAKTFIHVDLRQSYPVVWSY
jgi:zinc D-Ala-D-Ala carboxypeptidase